MGQSKSITVIGASDTGKTHFGAQLLGRLQADVGPLRLRHAPEDIEPFVEALRRLAQGVPASHTSVETYEEVLLPLELSTGDSGDLIWPDYGGEQLHAMMEQRHVSEEWRTRIREGYGWILFIRPALLQQQQDLFSRRVDHVIAAQDALEDHEPKGEESGWSDQAWYIELLQLLLFVRGIGTLDPTIEPKLAVVVSCWDEVDLRVDRPREVIDQEMPLFSEFLKTTWVESSLRIFGLSSLGRSLDKDNPDDEYQDHGPEAFGYVISADGEKIDDLSLPIRWLLSE